MGRDCRTREPPGDFAPNAALERDRVPRDRRAASGAVHPPPRPRGAGRGGLLLGGGVGARVNGGEHDGRSPFGTVRPCSAAGKYGVGDGREDLPVWGRRNQSGALPQPATGRARRPTVAAGREGTIDGKGPREREQVSRRPTARAHTHTTVASISSPPLSLARISPASTPPAAARRCGSPPTHRARLSRRPLVRRHLLTPRPRTYTIHPVA